MQIKILFVFTLGAFLLFPSLGKAQNDPSRLPVLFLTLLKEGRYQEAYQMQDQKMQELLSRDVLQKMWEDMKKDLGELRSFETQTTTKKDSYLVTTILCRFERMTLLAQVALDPQGKVAGLYFLPFTPREYAPPPYADESRFTERDVTFGIPGWELPGTLTIPKEKGPFPALLLVHGSGPNDRDETILGNKPFRDLAWGLATQGIAVLRYDKRTYVHGMKLTFPEMAHFTVEDEVLIDALKALEFLRKQPEIDGNNVFLLGHSLGGYLAPEIALRDGQLRGIILCAAPGRPLHQLVPEQMEYLFSLDGHVDPEETQKLESITRAVQNLDNRTLSPSATIPDLGGYASYFYSLMDINPLEIASQLLLPILAVQGGRDYQVSEPRDFALWKKALASKPLVSFRLYPTLNHLLFPGKGPSNPREYENPNHVDEALIQDIALWIKTNKTASPSALNESRE